MTIELSEAPATTVSLPDLADDWLISLEANGKSAATISTYKGGLSSLMRFCEAVATEPVIDRRNVDRWMAALRREGKAKGTIRLWYTVIRLFTAWATAVGELPADPLITMKPPPAGHPQVRSLTDAEISRILQACKGTSFLDRRDTALVMVFATTGARAAEVCALTLSDVDFKERLIYIRCGKGCKARRVPLTAKTAEALRNYQRARKSHPLAKTDALWLGGQGRTCGYQGVSESLSRRAKTAGVQGFHCHRMRHSYASRAKRNGMSDDELMELCGWSDSTMPRLYAADTVRERALATARRMELDKF